MLKFKVAGLSEEELEQHRALSVHQEHVRAHKAADAVVDYHVRELANSQEHARAAREERVQAKIALAAAVQDA